MDSIYADSDNNPIAQYLPLDIFPYSKISFDDTNDTFNLLSDKWFSKIYFHYKLYTSQLPVNLAGTNRSAIYFLEHSLQTLQVPREAPFPVVITVQKQKIVEHFNMSGIILST